MNITHWGQRVNSKILRYCCPGSDWIVHSIMVHYFSSAVLCLYTIIHVYACLYTHHNLLLTLPRVLLICSCLSECHGNDFFSFPYLWSQAGPFQHLMKQLIHQHRWITVFDTVVEGFTLTPVRHFYGRIMFLFLLIFINFLFLLIILFILLYILIKINKYIYLF